MVLSKVHTHLSVKRKEKGDITSPKIEGLSNSYFMGMRQKNKLEFFGEKRVRILKPFSFLFFKIFLMFKISTSSKT